MNRRSILTAAIFLATLSIGSIGLKSFDAHSKSSASHPGQSFAEKSTLAFAAKWSPDELIKRSGGSAPALKKHRADIEQSCQMFRKKLGDTKAVKSCHFLREETQKGVKRESYLLHLNCSKAPAAVTAVVCQKKNSWEILRLVVRSKELQSVIDPDPDELQAFAEEVVPKVSKNWSANSLVPYADDMYEQELRDNPIIQQTVLQSVRGLGQFKRMKTCQLGQKTYIDSRLVYIVAGQAEFENGDASLWLHMVEQENGWKLHRLNVQGTQIACR